MNEKCWICGSDKDLTGEHLIKKSDLKHEFPGKGPVFIHTDTVINQKVQGLGSGMLKSKGKICAHCNNTRTQPFDMAWSNFSDYLSNKKAVETGDIIDLKEIYFEEWRNGILNVHLYFVKLFGCAIKGNNIPIDLEPFSRAILNNQAHGHVYSKIWPPITKHVGYSDLYPIDEKPISRKIIKLAWYYELPKFCVGVFSNAQEHSQEIWPPVTDNGEIKVARKIVYGNDCK